MAGTNGAETVRYETRGGITVHRTVENVDGAAALEALTAALDEGRGALLASSYEYPGRYTRWDMGFVHPPLAIDSRGRNVRVAALNGRGRLLLPPLARTFERIPAVADLDVEADEIRVSIGAFEGRFPEEERSKQPSVFSVLRAVVELFGSDEDPHLGLYGAFGYDLAFHFEPLRLRLERPSEQRDLILYLPDELLVVDHRRERATRRRYDFEVEGSSTAGLPRDGARVPSPGPGAVVRPSDHAPGEYAAGVRVAREAFRKGDLFEVVLSQTFAEPAEASPSEIFRRLRRRNPSPYGFLLNLGDGEYLVGASPEMYVRVEGRRVETCPIAGTIKRGRDPIEDAEQIRTILNSEKDESELTMCTDVDRNDKSRICEPGSVRVIGRRQIEIYSRLIHTVDHVEGTLREGFDALDAFLCHTWAVTVTGAPKTWAMQFIEDQERSARAWYGGAVGLVGFDGNLNTGLTLRTIRLIRGVAEVRAGATLLYESDPDAEEEETHVKASALLDAILRPSGVPEDLSPAALAVGAGRRILLIDHQDSFVHTLANYLRQTGAEVVTWRSGFPPADLDALRPDLVVLSPGPGAPDDFDVSGTLKELRARGLPVFGVCLGLQGLVEHLGGRLDVLGYPVHGKPSTIVVRGGSLWEGLPRRFRAGRYHSLYAVRDAIPPELRITAETEDGVVMAVEHADQPLAAVQFHPESILTPGDLGLRLLANAVARLCT
jgi:anthranilate synthase